MNSSYLQRCITIAAISFLSACGGGGGGGSSAPPAPAPAPQEIANNDLITIIEDTPTTVNVLGNDTGVNTASLAINQPPSNGSASVTDNGIQYTPNLNFRGTDQLTYSVASNGGANLTAQLTITVNAITQTTLSVQNLTIPQTGFQSINNAQIGATVLQSPPISFSLAPNTVSMVAALTGDDVNSINNDMFITSLVDPNGFAITPLTRTVTFCDPGYCSALVPKRPTQTTPAGEWQISIGTLAPDLSNINLNGMSLRISGRVGPDPTSPLLRIRPYLTAPSINSTDLGLVLQELVSLGQQSGLTIQLDPIETVSEPQFAEVPPSFNDVTTASLIQQGAPDRINLFFIEDFSGSNGAGLLGVSGGLPGSLGQPSSFNGALINATANRGLDDANYARTTAEVAFHEMGHFLGLYHTTERQFGIHDVLDDTPECSSGNDRTNVGIQGVADIAECPDGQNPMFWNTDLSGNKTALSTDQRAVINTSPIAVPAT